MPLTVPNILVQDESGAATPVSGLNFQGGGVTATVSGGVANVAVPGYLPKSNFGIWYTTNASNTWGLLGLATPTVLGTVASAKTIATTNAFNQAKRIGYASSALAGNFAGVYAPNAAHFRSTTAGTGGFTCTWRWGCSDAAAVASARMFVGMMGGVAAPTNVDPTTLVNIVGVGQITTSANLQLLSNAGSGTATTTDLGSAFPAASLSLDMYELVIYCPQGGAYISATLTNLVSGAVVATQITTNLPAVSTLMAPRAWRCNNTTAAAVSIDIAAMYLEGPI